MGLISKIRNGHRKSSSGPNLDVPKNHQSTFSSSSLVGSDFRQRISSSSYTSQDTHGSPAAAAEKGLPPVKGGKRLPPALQPNLDVIADNLSQSPEGRASLNDPETTDMDEKPLPLLEPKVLPDRNGAMANGSRSPPRRIAPKSTVEDSIANEAQNTHTNQPLDSLRDGATTETTKAHTGPMRPQAAPLRNSMAFTDSLEAFQNGSASGQESMRRTADGVGSNIKPNANAIHESDIPYGRPHHRPPNMPIAPMDPYNSSPTFQADTKNKLDSPPFLPFAQSPYNYRNPSGGHLAYQKLNPAPAHDESCEEYSYSGSDDSASGDSVDSSVANSQVELNPYYDQWKAYFSFLAAQQKQQEMINSHRQSLYNSPYAANYMYQQNYHPGHMSMQALSPSGMALPMLQSPIRSSPHSRTPLSASREILYRESPLSKNIDSGSAKKKSYTALQTLNNNAREDKLVANSRKSTLKSNRYPSVPLSILRSESKDMEVGKKPRVASLVTDFKPKGSDSSDAQNDSFNNTVDYTQGGSNGNIAKKLSQLNVNDTPERQISDYTKFLFENEEENEPVDQSLAEEVSRTVSAHQQLLESADRNDDSGSDSDESVGSIQSETDKLMVKNSSPYGVSNDVKVGDTHASKPQAIISENPASKDIERPSSRVASDSSRSRAHAKSTSLPNQTDLFMPSTLRQSMIAPGHQSMFPMMPPPQLGQAMPPQMLPMPPQMPPPVDPYVMNPAMTPGVNPGMFPYNPMMNYSTEYQNTMPSYMNPRRQSIATPDLKRQSMVSVANGYLRSLPLNPRTPFGMPGVRQFSRVTDKDTKKRIEKLIELRQVIASGNKTLEYRLKWIKALIDATNYCLYTYINIKGEETGPEMAQTNKILFAKSAVNHLTKLLKELKHKRGKEALYSEACYIYGCLLKHDYKVTYNQDFGIEKDVEQALIYLEDSLEASPNNFKTLYKTGDIYEYEIPDEFEKAVDHYKLAAQLGYGKAIYKMALLHLHVPSMRSTKFFNLLVKLSSVDLNSDDIDLNEDDEEELQETIGLAFFELGKVYEGIYPGDLSLEDDFVVRSIEKAPVNYAKALTYYNKSARLNCLLAHVKLGRVYEFGELNRDIKPHKSIQWYMKAVSSPFPFKRLPEAMIGLSRWYLKGSSGHSNYIPVPNPDKAVLWCNRAIKEFNYPDAYFAMGQLIEKGLASGSPEEYYSKARDLGYYEYSMDSE